MVLTVNPDILANVTTINGLVGVSQPIKDELIKTMLEDMLKQGHHVVIDV